MKFIEMVKTEAENRLNEFIGCDVYLSDLGMGLTEYENNNGSWSCSREKDIENIKTYWNECADFVKYYKLNFGIDVPNVFENPENFFCCMMIIAIENLINQSIYNNEKLSNLLNEYEIVTIDEKIIKEFVKEFEKIEEVL